ncbi:MAG TPA: lysozyme inhibitor LprI family protein [Burkholderiaceae bacterium]
MHTQISLQRAFLVLLVSFAAESGARALYPEGCTDLRTTQELAECRQKQMEAADARLEKYLAAARSQASAIAFDVTLIDDEQRAWVTYRTKHCGNVYTLSGMGSIRFEMSAVCTLEVTRERTIDVWRAYLTYQDSTPPVLPDPSP